MPAHWAPCVSHTRPNPLDGHVSVGGGALLLVGFSFLYQPTRNLSRLIRIRNFNAHKASGLAPSPCISLSRKELKTPHPHSLSRSRLDERERETETRAEWERGRRPAGTWRRRRAAPPPAQPTRSSAGSGSSRISSTSRWARSSPFLLETDYGSIHGSTLFFTSFVRLKITLPFLHLGPSFILFFPTDFRGFLHRSVCISNRHAWFLCAGFGDIGDVEEPAPGGEAAETEQGDARTYTRLPHAHARVSWWSGDAGLTRCDSVFSERRAREPQGEKEVRRHRGAAFLEGEGHGLLQGRCEFFVGLLYAVFVKSVTVSVPCLGIPIEFYSCDYWICQILYFNCVAQKPHGWSETVSGCILSPFGWKFRFVIWANYHGQTTSLRKVFWI